MLVRFLEELGFEDLEVGLNSVGDVECRQRYSQLPARSSSNRTVTNWAGTAGGGWRPIPLRILDTKAPKERKLLERRPAVVSMCLGGRGSRRHFQDRARATGPGSVSPTG